MLSVECSAFRLAEIVGKRVVVSGEKSVEETHGCMI